MVFPVGNGGSREVQTSDGPWFDFRGSQANTNVVQKGVTQWVHGEQSIKHLLDEMKMAAAGATLTLDTPTILKVLAHFIAEGPKDGAHAPLGSMKASASRNSKKVKYEAAAASMPLFSS